MPVLVADDDENIREIMVDVLEMAGYRVLSAPDGREALALAARERPSLVLLDVRMPLVNGWDVAAALARWPDPPPVVMVSASHDGRATAKRLGLPYLAKPFEFGELLAMVARHRASVPGCEPTAAG